MVPHPPFTVRRPMPGVVQIDSRYDAAYRKALLAGVPTQLLPKMREALAATPDAGARKHAERYFGKEREQVFAAAADVAATLHRYLEGQFGLPGLLDWLTLTNYGNDYRMIKVFKAWSEMRVRAETEPKPLPAGSRFVMELPSPDADDNG